MSARHLQTGKVSEVSAVKKLNRNSAFTLIELMIVVVIVGILAAMAIPRFMRVSTKSKQSEAKLILKQIYVNQQAYRQAGPSYFLPAGPASAASRTAFRDILIAIEPNAMYTYSIIGDATSVTATATSGVLDEDPVPDIWQIDQLGNLTCISNDALL